jgi:gliding motility-associated-like protein
MKQVRNIYTIIILLLLRVDPGMAQLCQGSLGDPVVNITFGSGSYFGNELSAATTSYTFLQTYCPNDGYYSVVNKTSFCFFDTWHTLSQDHTGNNDGYFMLINASFQPGDFYVDTVRGLCANTTFEFAAWVVNVLKPSACNSAGIKPNLTFYIETTAGIRLDSLKTGDIPADNSPIWKQYGFFFKTPPAVTDVVVRIRNNAPGGCGNDLALDDITFTPCGPKVNVSVAGAGSSDTLDICDDDTKTYTLQGNVSSGYTAPAYQWQQSNDGINWTDISGEVTTTYKRQPTLKGSYYYRLAVAEAGNINSSLCRIVSNAIIFHVNEKPITTASSNSPVCEGTTLSLNATGGDSYQWKGPDNYTASGSSVSVSFNVQIQNVTFAAAGTYYVTVTANACSQKDSVVVSIKQKPTANAGKDTGFCEGNSIMLNASGGNTYSWQPATGLSATNIPNPVASPADSTAYIVTATDNASGCIDDDTVIINVYHKPVADAGPDKTMIEGDNTTLSANASKTFVDYYWTPNIYIANANSLQPTVNPPHDTTYTLHVRSTVGCGEATDDVFVKVFKKVIVPNAFSPNKDGINDEWRLEAIDVYPDADVTVFNRYGQAVFSTRGYNKPWDGTYNNNPLPVGTYYYVIDLKFGLPKLKGWVMILR